MVSSLMFTTNTDDVPCVCVDVGPRLPASYEQWRGRVEGVDPPTPGPQSTLCSLCHDIESLPEGVTDDSWQHLDDDLITSFYHAPLEWIPRIKRIAVAT